ncbi:MAG: ATP-dependent helicase [Planctomycetota bacterium]
MSSQLTAAQQAAVEHTEGPLLVLAGPGSGKTRVITHRISRLLETGAAPDQILALTFTNKAAREMSARAGRLTGGSRVQVSTFHRFCARLLRRWPERVGLKANFTILDQPDQTAIIRRIMKDLNLDSSVHEPGRVLARISRARNDMITSAEFQQRFEQRVSGPIDAAVCIVFPEYERRVREQNSVDFDDLLLHVVRMLHEEPELRSILDEQFRWILVDEYQDTNFAQYQIVHAMSQDYRNLCVTGDPDQSIYGWRGVRPANIAAFERDYPERAVVSLDQNFRSTGRIVRCADRLISGNRRPHRGRLTTANPDGSPVRLIVFADEEAEADAIAQEILAEVSSGHREFRDFAIFYRVNALSRLFETSLARHQIPCQVAAGYSFFERTEVRDLVAWLRLIENRADDAAFERIINRPTRGIGETSLQRLRNYASRERFSLFDAALQAKHVQGLSARTVKAMSGFTDLIQRLHAQSADGRVAPLLERLIAEIDYMALWKDDQDEPDEDRAANVYELVSAARQYDGTVPDDPETPADSPLTNPPSEPPSLQGFLEIATLSSEVDSINSEHGAVTLMTLHASKGLEFPCVYVTGLETGLIPHERSLRDGDPAALEEERRLLFVGITRAMHSLTLTQTTARFFRGTRRTTISSPFVREIASEIQLSSAHSSRSPAARTAADKLTPAPTPSTPLDDRLTQARRRFDEATQQGKARPLIMTGAQLAALSTPAPDAEAADATDDAPGSHGYRPGMLVRHPRYGRGRITEVSGGSHRATVTVEFEGENTSHSFVASRCPLQPVGLQQ